MYNEIINRFKKKRRGERTPYRNKAVVYLRLLGFTFPEIALILGIHEFSAPRTYYKNKAKYKPMFYEKIKTIYEQRERVL